MKTSFAPSIVVATCVLALAASAQPVQPASGAVLSEQEAQDSVVVEGIASYRQRIALPPDAVFTVRIEDISRADAPAQVMAELSRPLAGAQSPLPFKLEVDKSKISARARYSLRATIHVQGQLRFTTTQMTPVLNTAAATPVALTLQPVRKPR